MISKILNLLKKTYVIIILFFCSLDDFFDTNSVLMHFELNQKIKKLESQKNYYKKKLKKIKLALKKLNLIAELKSMLGKNFL